MIILKADFHVIKCEYKYQMEFIVHSRLLGLAFITFFVGNIFSHDSLNSVLYQLERIQNQYHISGDLSRTDAYALRLIRNGIFANHGRLFKSDDLSYFFYERNDVVNKIGFEESDDYIDSDLTYRDMLNLDIVLKAEADVNYSWRDSDLTLEETINSYHLNEILKRSFNGEDHKVGIPKPRAYRVYPDHNNKDKYFLYIWNELLFSDSRGSRTFFRDQEKYNVIDFKGTAHWEGGYISNSMSLLYSYEEIKTFKADQIDVVDFITELYQAGIIVPSFNTEVIERFLWTE